MARIMIANWAKKTLEVTDFSKTLLGHFHDNRLDWMHSCGGKGRCTTCKTIVLDGSMYFEPLTAAEQRYRDMGALGATERLCCQAKINGTVTLAVPEEYKLPHIDYTK